MGGNATGGRDIQRWYENLHGGQGGGRYGNIRYRAAGLGRDQGQLRVSTHLRDDVSAHEFWYWGTT